jgi:uracil-DNA glycosylase family 4
MPISSKKSLKKLNEEISICKKCLDLAKTRVQPVSGIGAPNSRLIITGFFPDAAGAEASGIPFFGSDEGDMLRALIADTGLSLEEDTYLTYIVKCTARKMSETGGAAEAILCNPNAKHSANCINYFTEEISITTPHIIISLGLEASNLILENFFSVTKKHTDISQIHMRLFENPSFKLVPVYSPSDVLKGLISEQEYFGDFRKLSKIFSII